MKLGPLRNQRFLLYCLVGMGAAYFSCLACNAQAKDSVVAKKKVKEKTRVSPQYRPPNTPPPVYAPPQQPYAPLPYSMPPPQRTSAREDGGVIGLDRFYALAGTGFRSDTFSRNVPPKPSATTPGLNTIEQKSGQNFSLLGSGVIGWGPVRYYDFLLNLHYAYTQDWGTESEQVLDRFFKRWFSKPTREDFIFTTKGLTRTHELVLDFRYATPVVQLGLFSRISFSFIGSTLLGSNLESEATLQQSVSENFVPYLSYRVGSIYQGEVAIPLRTEINKEDVILSNKTYDFKNRGRGRLIGGMSNHRVYFSTIRSYLFLSAYYTPYKFGSLQQDRDRLGADLSLDFPVISTWHALPQFSFYQDNFPLVRPRVEQTPAAITRVDNVAHFGFSSYVDVSKRHRFSGDLQVEIADSTITEYKTMRFLASFGYTYAFPSVAAVARRTQRFTEAGFGDDF